MAKSARIEVRTYWDRVEPDGTRCYVCDDLCLLEMWRMFYSADKIAKRTPSQFVICDSCHRAAMEE